MTYPQETGKRVGGGADLLERMSDTPTPVTSRRRDLGLVVLFTVLVLAIAFVSPLLGGNAQQPGPGFVLWGMSPLLVALGLRITTRDRSDLGMRPGLRRNSRWYLVSLLAVPAVMALVLIVGTVTSAVTVESFDPGRYFGLAVVALAGLFVPALFEEFGWRGYLAPKVAALGINRYLGHAFVGAVWATWHLPFVAGFDWRFGAEGLATLVPRFYLVCIALSIVYGEIRAITGTLWPAVVMHASGNAFGHLLVLDYLRVEPGRQWLGSITTSVIAIAAFAALGAGIHRRRTRQTSTVSTPDQSEAKVSAPE